MDPRDRLIIALGDELLRMSSQLSKVAEKKMLMHCATEGCQTILRTDDDFISGYCAACRTVSITPSTNKIPQVLDIVPPTNFHQAAKILLQTVGEDPDRDGLKETPERFRKAWSEMLCGYGEDVASYFKMFDVKYDEMIVLKDIEFTSFCEHHLLPFGGLAHVGYVPGDKVIGLSKIARVFLAFAKRLQVQERLTNQVTEAFNAHLPGVLGVACVVEASHACMACRGVRLPRATMVTSSMTGVFREKPEARAEFFSCVRN